MRILLAISPSSYLTKKVVIFSRVGILLTSLQNKYVLSKPRLREQGERRGKKLKETREVLLEEL